MYSFSCSNYDQDGILLNSLFDLSDILISALRNRVDKIWLKWLFLRNSNKYLVFMEYLFYYYTSFTSSPFPWEGAWKWAVRLCKHVTPLSLTLFMFLPLPLPMLPSVAVSCVENKGPICYVGQRTGTNTSECSHCARSVAAELWS